MSGMDSWLENAIIFGVYPGSGGGGGGSVTELEVQRWAFNSQAATGANDAFIVDLNPEVTDLTDGLIVSMTSGLLENLTATPTLQINAMPPKLIRLWGTSIAPGDIQPGASYLFMYSVVSDTFQLINPSLSIADTFVTQSNIYNSAIDTGSGGTYEVALTPSHQGSFNVGFPVYFLSAAGNSNTGATTITVDGTTAPIVRQDGSALAAGDIVGGRVYFLLYNTSFNAFALQNPTVTVSPGGLMPWTDVPNTSRTLAVNNGYTTSNIALTTLEIPAVAPYGSVIAVQGASVGGWVLTCPAGVTIRGGSEATTPGGTVTAQAGTDNVYLLCVVANTTWVVTSSYSQGLTYL